MMMDVSTEPTRQAIAGVASLLASGDLLDMTHGEQNALLRLLKRLVSELQPDTDQEPMPAEEPMAESHAPSLPNVTLSWTSVMHLKEAKRALSHEPVEHFLSFGIGRDGEICFEDDQTSHEATTCV